MPIDSPIRLSGGAPVGSQAPSHPDGGNAARRLAEFEDARRNESAEESPPEPVSPEKDEPDDRCSADNTTAGDDSP